MTFMNVGRRGRGGLLAIALLSAVSIGVGFGVFRSTLHAESADPDATAPSDPSAAEAPAKRKSRLAARKARQKAAQAGSAKEPTAAAAAAPSAASPAFSAQLDKAGASTCSAELNALASATMGGVSKYNLVSNWSTSAGDKRSVSVAIGQRYQDGSAVPYGVSQVIASPNRAGSCDGFALQVLPSPLPCDRLRQTMATQHGQQIGDLAGISLMQDATGRTLLVPTAANTCVLVATRTAYAK